MTDSESPEKLAREAQAAYKRGEYAAAMQKFKAASEAYRSSGDELNAAEMANNACVSALQCEDLETALGFVQGTPEIFSVAGDLRRYGMALANLGTTLEALERNEEALENYRQAADILEQAGEDEMRASVMQSLSMLQFELGRRFQALASMHDGLEGVRKPSPKQAFLKKLLDIPMDMLTRKSGIHKP